jgi:hypothetical protein
MYFLHIRKKGGLMQEVNSLIREWCMFLRWMAHEDVWDDKDWQAGRTWEEIAEYFRVHHRARSLDQHQRDLEEWSRIGLLVFHSNPERWVIGERTHEMLQMLDNPIFKIIARHEPLRLEDLGGRLRIATVVYASNVNNPHVNHTTSVDPARFEIASCAGEIGQDTDEEAAATYDHELLEKLAKWERHGLILRWQECGKTNVSVHPGVRAYCGFPHR